MATVRDLLDALEIVLRPPLVALKRADGTSPAVTSGTDYPSADLISAVTRANGVLLSVYDRKIVRNSTRWTPNIVLDNLVAAVAQVTLGPLLMVPGSAVPGLLTVAATTQVGDLVALGLSVSKSSVPTIYSTVVQANDTPALVAGRLAASIAADPNAVVTASQVAGSISLTPISAPVLGFATAASTGSTRLYEIGRRERQFQIMLWTATDADRTLAGSAVESVLAQLESYFGVGYPAGLALADQTSARLKAVSDFEIDDQLLSDVLRRDFIVSLDYSVTYLDQLVQIICAQPLIQLWTQAPQLASFSVSSGTPIVQNGQLIGVYT